MAGTQASSGGATPQVLRYPTTPPPLSAGDIAEFGSRRRAATRGLQTAMARREHGTQSIDQLFKQFSKRLDTERGRVQRNTMGVLGGRGVARNPRQGGQALADIRDSFADRRASAEADRAGQLSALEQMVSEARSARDEELTAIEADKTRRRTSLDQLIRQIGG